MKDETYYFKAIELAEKQLKKEIRFRFQLILLGMVWFFICVASIAIGILVEDISGMLRIGAGFTVVLAAVVTITMTVKGIPQVGKARKELADAWSAHLDFLMKS